MFYAFFAVIVYNWDIVLVDMNVWKCGLPLYMTPSVVVVMTHYQIVIVAPGPLWFVPINIINHQTSTIFLFVTKNYKRGSIIRFYTFLP